jgi:hypothetical protein
MTQIPSVDWPRRISPIIGNEDLLKQNPVTDDFPQEERIPVSLIGDYTISRISPINTGNFGVGTFAVKLNDTLFFRRVGSGSNKVNVGLNDGTIVIDVNPINIANEISLTDISNVTPPTSPNHFLKWNGSYFEFSPVSSKTLFIYMPQQQVGPQLKVFNDGDAIGFVGFNGITAQFSPNVSSNFKSVDIIFTGGLPNLSDVNISGPVPDGYVLSYDSTSSKWIPTPVSGSTYTFNVKADALNSSTVQNSNTLSIVGSANIFTTLTSTNEIEIGWSGNLEDLDDVDISSLQNNHVLVYDDSLLSWTAKNLADIGGTANLTFSNGLFKNNNIVRLGGLLTQNTTINADNRTFTINNLNSFITHSIKNTTTPFVATHTHLLQQNNVGGLTILYGSNSSDLNQLSIELDTRKNEISNLFRFTTTQNYFKSVVSSGQSAILYEENSVPKTGFFVYNNSIKVIDGFTPNTGDVLTLQSDGTARFVPPVAGSGGTGGDNWGVQDVISNSTLTGNGTLSSPLAVTRPVPSGGNSNQYLGIVGSSVTWVNLPKEQYVGFCEVEATSEVNLLDGKLFFVVPQQLSSYKLKSFIASVSIAGSGGTTDIEVMKNGTQVATASISSSFVSVGALNVNLVTGDRISINVIGVRNVTKDRGLSLTFYLEP